MNEPQTASELMVESQLPKQVDCVLPSQTIQKFLLDLISQSNFPGNMSEFVSHVKSTIGTAQIR